MGPLRGARPGSVRSPAASLVPQLERKSPCLRGAEPPVGREMGVAEAMGGISRSALPLEGETFRIAVSSSQLRRVPACQVPK